MKSAAKRKKEKELRKLARKYAQDLEKFGIKTPHIYQASTENKFQRCTLLKTENLSFSTNSSSFIIPSTTKE